MKEVRKSARARKVVGSEADELFVSRAEAEELAKQLKNALMVILARAEEDFQDEDGEQCDYRDGGNLLEGGEISGYGDYDFEFKEAVQVIAKYENHFPKYGEARTFDNRAFLQMFTTREGADVALNALKEALRKGMM